MSPSQPPGLIGLALLGTGPAHAAGGTPTTPTELFNADQACSTDATAPVYVTSRAGLTLEGIPSDTDTSVSTLTEQFQVWPVSDPAQITTSTHPYALSGNEAAVDLADGSLADGRTYAWQARTTAPDGTASAWSAPCYVTDDDTAPSAAPTVVSANYPQGQADQGGAPVQFTFGADGVQDVAGFEYSWTQDMPVAGVAEIGDHGIPQYQDPYSDPRYFARADTLGGTATASLIPPAGYGFVTLHVVSLDRALNRSPMATYSFIIKNGTPTVTQLSKSPQFGKLTTFKLTPDPKLQAASPVVSYTVETLGWQGQSTTTVQASADGTAELNLTLDDPYGTVLLVSSTSADGWVSGNDWWNSGNVDTSPTVTSDVYTENASSGGAGVPGTFTFTPKVKSIASYTYAFNWGPGTTVKAGGQGSAQISWTPSQSGWYDLEVYATTKDGIQLAPYDYYFTVK